MKGICKSFLVAGVGVAAVGLCGAVALAEVVIYQGQPAQSSGVKLQSWGSGEATDSEEQVYTGVKSVKVKTHGRYQGGRLVLAKPANVKDTIENPRVYFELAVLVPEKQGSASGSRLRMGGGMAGPGGMTGSGGMMGPGGRRGGTSGGMRGPGGGMMGPGGGMMGPGGGMMGPGGGTMGRGGSSTSPGGGGSRSGAGGGTMGPGGSRGGRGGTSGGMMGPGGMGGDSSGAGPGGSGGMGGDTARGLLVEPKAIRNVRVVLVMTDGKQVDMTLPLEFARPTREGWRTLAVPLSSLPAMKSVSGEIAELRVFGDSVGTLYVGQIRTILDDTPIRVEDLQERTVAVNDTVKFTGSAEAGVSQLKYQWTVTKAGERPAQLPVDAEGRTFEHKFRKGGEYEVVLTVVDVYGRKKPATSVAKVRVTL
jgi:hypothetical protein